MLLHASTPSLQLLFGFVLIGPFGNDPIQLLNSLALMHWSLPIFTVEALSHAGSERAKKIASSVVNLINLFISPPKYQ